MIEHATPPVASPEMLDCLHTYAREPDANHPATAPLRLYDTSTHTLAHIVIEHGRVVSWILVGPISPAQAAEHVAMHELLEMPTAGEA